MLPQLLTLVFLLSPICLARICDDTLKGICKIDSELSNWCTYDKKTKLATCDHEQYCANHTQLRNKVNTAGCIGNKCCCNQKHLCNQQFLEVETQKCTFKTQVPNEHTLIYNDCEEEWCFAMITANLAGGETTTLRGCESRSMLKHMENEVEIKENETAWQLSKPFFKQMRCFEIVTDKVAPDENNTRRACVDFNYADSYGMDRMAKLCCCAGNAYCNDAIEWSDLAFTVQSDLLIINTDKDASSASTVIYMCALAQYFPLILVLQIVLSLTKLLPQQLALW